MRYYQLTMMINGSYREDAGAYSYLWQDPALRALEDWLRENTELPPNRLADVVDGVWVYYSYSITPILLGVTGSEYLRRPLMGIAATRDVRALSYLDGFLADDAGHRSALATAGVGLFLSEERKSMTADNIMTDLHAAFRQNMENLRLPLQLPFLPTDVLPPFPPATRAAGIGKTKHDDHRSLLNNDFIDFMFRYWNRQIEITPLGVFIDDL